MIRVPENWPMAWWSSDASLIRMACPSCGEFQLFADRSDGVAKIACRSCSLAGARQVQAAMDAWGPAHEAARERDAAAHRHAMGEADTGTARRRQTEKRENVR